MSTGIDIGKYSTKIVELSLTKGEVAVKKIGSLKTFKDINKFDLEKISKSQLEACVQDLCKQLNINARKTRASISSARICIFCDVESRMDWSVNAILVPVSPSGTGKTLILFKYS